MLIENKINFANAFHSIQGEGPFMGMNSVFLRLGGCNLECGLIGKDGSPWKCDTELEWKTGRKFSTAGLEIYFETRGLNKVLDMGSALVLTGGEPMLQQKAILPFLQKIKKKYGTYIHVETNGTVKPKSDFNKCIECYVVSPKLSTTGMPRKRRIKDKAMEDFACRFNAAFKFVVIDRDDIKEIKELEEKHKIPKHKIYLMPAAANKHLLSKYKYLAWELAIENGYNYSHRLHISLFDSQRMI